jgi:hypothetical protein
VRIPAPVAAAFALAVLAAPALADTLRVPSEATPTIQSAVEAAADGDTILVAAGNYNETVTLVGRNDLTLRAQGAAVLDSGTFTIAGGGGISLVGFTVQNTNGHGISASDCPGLLISKTTVTGAFQRGISLSTCNGASISKCTIQGSGSDGLQDYGSEDLVIEKCTISGNGGYGIILSSGASAGNASDRARILKNLVTGSANALYCNGVDILVEKNDFEAYTGTGIYVDSSAGSQGVVIQKNSLSTEEPSQYGIRAYMAQSVVSKNYVGDTATTGIQVVGDGNLLEKNTVDGGTVGIHVFGTGVTVEKNLVETVGSIAFHIDAGSGATVTKNRAVSPGSVGFLIGQEGCMLTSNSVTNAGDIGFALNATGQTLVKNSARGSGDFDLASPHSEGAFMLDRNRFETVAFNLS